MVVEMAETETTGAMLDVKGGGAEVIGVDGNNEDSDADAGGHDGFLDYFWCFAEFFRFGP
jgi:hypothetical protein